MIKLYLHLTKGRLDRDENPSSRCIPLSQVPGHVPLVAVPLILAVRALVPKRERMLVLLQRPKERFGSPSLLLGAPAGLLICGGFPALPTAVLTGHLEDDGAEVTAHCLHASLTLRGASRTHTHTHVRGVRDETHPKLSTWGGAWTCLGADTAMGQRMALLPAGCKVAG